MHENSLLSSLLFSSLLILNSCGKKDNKTEEIRADLLQKLETSRQKVVQELIEPGYEINLEIGDRSLSPMSPLECVPKTLLREQNGVTVLREFTLYPHTGISADVVCPVDKNYLEERITVGSHDYGIKPITINEIYVQCKNLIQNTTIDPKDYENSYSVNRFYLEFDEFGYLKFCETQNWMMMDGGVTSYKMYKRPPISQP